MDVKIACAQIQIEPGNPEANTRKALQAIAKARAAQVDILLLPELMVPGYLLGDLWEQSAFLQDCEAWGREIIAASEGLCVIFGNIATDPAKVNEDGRLRKYNAAFVAQDGKLLRGGLPYPFISKTSLPDYREFDDSRYFHSIAKLLPELGPDVTIEDLVKPVSLTLRGRELKLGVLLCEDGWTENYHYNVPELLKKNGAQILCNLSCSPYTFHKNRKRHDLFVNQSRSCAIPLVYCNNVGIQNNGKNVFTYDGCSCMYDARGEMGHRFSGLPGRSAGEPVESGYRFHPGRTGTPGTLVRCPGNLPVPALRGLPVPGPAGDPKDDHRGFRRHRLRRHRRFLRGYPGSGKCAPGEHAQPVQFRSDQKPGPENGGKPWGPATPSCPSQEVVDKTILQFSSTDIHNYATGNDFHLKVTPFAAENIQARDRGARVLAGLASLFGGGFSCNSNKAEMTVGYATFYGDIAGVLALIGDLWKHQVYGLGRYLNEEVFRREVIPDEIFKIKPSAELSAAQTVGTGGDPLVYPYHDYLLQAFVESWNKTSPEELLGWYLEGTLEDHLGCEKGLVRQLFPDVRSFIDDLERWWKLFCGLAVAKRIQAPPILTISKRAYGYDHREAQLKPSIPGNTGK